ncbi:hypothetical protein [Hymenobacter metallicola]|uniref:ApeA N-terminal domain-containing protein n=1 Tax=Hymenobacter metallicola TaxID=2563114 RepID=A0A4Z0QGR1_9BACT|nr:hypothetical protein [Hymenobacter metallicola]TGE29237.1 hypothetical protein E5K02_07225 [Hymenobacter metallicola]
MGQYLFNGFTYVDRLNDEILSSYPDSLRFDAKPSYESLLFRLILGQVYVNHENSDISFEQKINYSKLSEEFTSTNQEDPVIDWIDNEFGLLDLHRYFLVNRMNENMYKELIVEFTWFFLNKSKENHVAAFLNLYRALEYISYSFPLSFFSKSNRYYASYDTFKGFFTDKDQGQLKFFQEFLKAYFEKSTLAMFTKLDTYAGSSLFDKNKYKIIKSLCSEFPFRDNGSVISIAYENMFDFMINLRNRYFHFQSDRVGNISNYNFDGELFFAGLNDKFVNWISAVYLEILTHGVYKLNLIPEVS